MTSNFTRRSSINVVGNKLCDNNVYYSGCQFICTVQTSFILAIISEYKMSAGFCKNVMHLV
jgi:hypothetical protein